MPVGLVVELDLPELGLTELAWVTDIADCPEIESRDSGRSAGGSVVTATFHHSSGDVIDLTLGSKSSTLAPPETIGTTSNHPFWSVDRQEYVQAGQLDVGERVLTFSGDTKRVVTKLPRPGPQPVYNLEVHAEHVYFVGEDGLLVHNSGTKYLDGARFNKNRTLAINVVNGEKRAYRLLDGHWRRIGGAKKSPLRAEFDNGGRAAFLKHFATTGEAKELVRMGRMKP